MLAVTIQDRNIIFMRIGMNIKVLSVNIHSHYNKMTEEAFNKALTELSGFIVNEQIDIIALQECGQTCEADIAEGTLPGSFFAIPKEKAVLNQRDNLIRKDNFACLLAEKLQEQNAHYYWCFAGAKIGYDRFDEGLAVFSRHPVKEADAFYYSNQTDYHNWKSRRCIGLKVDLGDRDAWFYSVHMGWWKDEEEPFSDQMDRLDKSVRKHKENVFLLGDFNSQADLRGEGYDYVKNLGWQDAYELAAQKDSGVTVPGTIDGWSDVASGMRIDYCFLRERERILSSRVVFGGDLEPVISDHFGVLTIVSL